MAMSGQTLSRIRPKPAATVRAGAAAAGRLCRGLCRGHETGLHRHPRAQLLFATAGVMRITTEAALFTVPPGTGLWVPADTCTRFAWTARCGCAPFSCGRTRRPPVRRATTVIAVSPLLRELILAVCGQPAVWERRADPAGRGAGAARDRPGGVPDAVAAGGRDPRLVRVRGALLADPADPRDLTEMRAAGASVRTLARLFRAETG